MYKSFFKFIGVSQLPCKELVQVLTGWMTFLMLNQQDLTNEELFFSLGNATLPM